MLLAEHKWYPGRVVRQRSAKPRTAVRIRWVPLPKLSLRDSFFYTLKFRIMALTKEEQDFVAYWEANRLNKKRFLRQFSIGLPFSAVMVLAIFINIFSGWNRRAEMVIRGDTSGLYVIIIAVVGIAVFMIIFSSRHKWDQNEQRYLELLQKEKGPDAAH